MLVPGSKLMLNNKLYVQNLTLLQRMLRQLIDMESNSTY